jgi:amidase
MARTIDDTAALLQAIAGYDGIDDRQLGAPKPADVPDYPQLVKEGRANGVNGMRIAVLSEAWAEPNLAPTVRAGVEAAIARYKALGADVQEVSIPLQRLAGSMLHVINKFGSGGTRLGRQVGRRGLYINPYWGQLLPWDQHKYDKAKYFVTGTAMSR